MLDFYILPKRVYVENSRKKCELVGGWLYIQ